MSFYFSKSKYTEFFKCPKACWLSKYRPEEKIITEIEKQTMEEGNYIGDIGMALLGDYVEVGCNSVLNPGTVVGKNSNIYPLSRVRGVIPADSIFKSNDKVVKKY